MMPSHIMLFVPDEL